jgi:hypothetical protein
MFTISVFCFSLPYCSFAANIEYEAFHRYGNISEYNSIHTEYNDEKFKNKKLQELTFQVQLCEALQTDYRELIKKIRYFRIMKKKNINLFFKPWKGNLNDVLNNADARLLPNNDKSYDNTFTFDNLKNTLDNKSLPNNIGQKYRKLCNDVIVPEDDKALEELQDKYKTLCDNENKEKKELILKIQRINNQGKEKNKILISEVNISNMPISVQKESTHSENIGMNCNTQYTIRIIYIILGVFVIILFKRLFHLIAQGGTPGALTIVFFCIFMLGGAISAFDDTIVEWLHKNMWNNNNLGSNNHNILPFHSMVIVTALCLVSASLILFLVLVFKYLGIFGKSENNLKQNLLRNKRKHVVAI